MFKKFCFFSSLFLFFSCQTPTPIKPIFLFLVNFFFIQKNSFNEGTIEQYYINFWKNKADREERFKILEERLQKSKLSEEEKEKKRKVLDVRETELLRLRRRRLNVNSFKTITIIGRGAFGEVKLKKQ